MSSGLKVFLASAILAVTFVLGEKRGMDRIAPSLAPKTETDTLYIRDTIHVPKPVPKHIYHKDTVLIPSGDTIRVSDTVYLAVEKEYKVYEDSLFRAVVSGYRPSLDEIDIYRREKIVTVTTTVVKEQPKWGFGVGLGPGLMLDTRGELRAGVAAVVGIEWRF